MNEQLFASRIRQALDESADRLPYRVTQRLERARLAAVARAAAATSIVSSVSGGAATVSMPSDDRPSGLVRLLSTLGPILLIIAGFYGIAAWDDAQRAADTADIDAEIVLSDDDDVPLSALTDRGFGVYIKNSRQ
ncbi:MAG: DUF3619 family protein [Burkholderiales bacterium]|nr:DUF3619 family protein [Burkholderiales bacterium]